MLDVVELEERCASGACCRRREAESYVADPYEPRENVPLHRLSQEASGGSRSEGEAKCDSRSANALSVSVEACRGQVTAYSCTDV